METADIPRLMLVAPSSGCGKTTVTCGILQAIKNRKMRVASFKCGPDYIDPAFHSKVIGAKSSNLDIFMCGEQNVKFLLAKNSYGCEFSLIEGVMGMYDGMGFSTDNASSNHLSQLTNTPQILIVNVKGMSMSILPLISGFLSFRENNIKGIILNCCSAATYPAYKKLIEDEFPIHVYGHLPYIKEAALESRHLGLITPNELENISQKLLLLADAVEKSVELDGLIALANSALTLEYEDVFRDIKPIGNVKIAVARDNAFSFIYEDNLDLLKKMGAEIVYFSPISDKNLPEDIDGILLYGGYPEEYARQLSENKTMLEEIKNAINGGIPTIAECGGFMYLMEKLTDKNGITYQMVGAVKGEATMQDRLSRFGYIKITANRDNILCKKGESIAAHEFHYSDSNGNGDCFTAHKNGREWECIHATDTLFAGYPHLHFYGNVNFAGRFIKKCKEGKSKWKF